MRKLSSLQRAAVCTGSLPDLDTVKLAAGYMSIKYVLKSMNPKIYIVSVSKPVGKSRFHSRFSAPSLTAKWSAFHPSRLTISSLAPCCNRNLTVSVNPFIAFEERGVGSLSFLNSFRVHFLPHKCLPAIMIAVQSPRFMAFTST